MDLFRAQEGNAKSSTVRLIAIQDQHLTHDIEVRAVESFRFLLRDSPHSLFTQSSALGSKPLLWAMKTEDLYDSNGYDEVW